MERDKRNITLEDALSAISENVPVLGVRYAESWSAVGSISRRDIISDVDYPTADISAVDGYCLTNAATSRASTSRPSVLGLRGTIKAGDLPNFELGNNECAHVMTGAVLPEGADAVVKAEEVTVKGDRVAVSRTVPAGSFVRKAGEIARKGEKVLAQGAVITPAVVGLLATFGCGRVEVSRKARVGVLATGDELVPHDTYPERGRIRSSNAYMLKALISDMGLPVFDAGMCRDTEQDIVSHIEACEACEALIVTGGSALGGYDLVPEALEKVGAEVIFRGLRMSPGRHMVFARQSNRVYFCLPGNPVACFVLFHVIVKPGLLMMMGARHPFPSPLQARWAGCTQDGLGSRVFFPSRLLKDFRVEPVRFTSSADVLSLAAADCLVSLPENMDRVERGQVVDVFLVSAASGQEA